MNKRILVIALIVSIVFNAAFVGTLGYRLWQRQKTPPGHDAGPKRTPERFEPPPELRERLDALREDFKPKMRSHRQDLTEARKALVLLLKEENPDSLAIESVLRRIADYQLALEREVVFHLLDQKAILPLEYRERFLDMVTRRLEGHRRPSSSDYRQNDRRREETDPKPGTKQEE